MRSIDPALQAKLESGATTLCRCWIVQRRDDVTLGFTDHDEDVTVDGVLCRAGAGLNGSEIEAQLGLAVTGSDVTGALADETLAEDDLAAGRFDAADVLIYLVDWREPHLNLLLSRCVLGEVRRDGARFTAELRSLTHRLAEANGRLFTAGCAADLGDSRCGVDLTLSAFRGVGNVVAVAADTLLDVSGLGSFADGWFTAGRLTFTSGANAGLAVEVKSHRLSTGAVSLSLWQVMPEPIAPGDSFQVTAGCDKRFDTCRLRFGNAANFRGFPHIPGNDFVISYPQQGEPGHHGDSFGPGAGPG